MNGVVIVKVGGDGLTRSRDLGQLAAHVRELRAAGLRPVIVHGGGPEIGRLHDKLGVDYRRQLGLRVTSEASMELVTMVMCGLVNKRLVAALQGADLPAIGLSGADLGMMRSSFINETTLGRVGGPPRIAPGLVVEQLEKERTPVIAPVCLAPDGGLLNVNADVAAQGLAVTLEAERLELVTDVASVRTERGPARALQPADVQRLVRQQVVTGGMIPKLQASVAAVDGGVGRVWVGTLESLAQGTATEVHA